MKQFRDTPYYVTENGEVYRLWKIGFKKLKIYFNNDGYAQISIAQFGLKKTYLVHRIVGELFIENPNNLPEINHHDGDKKNNNISNLYWCTRAENIRHSFDTGLNKGKKGQSNNNSKLSEQDIIWIKQNHIPFNKKFGSRALSKKFNVCQGHISRIINNKGWNHL